METKFHLFFFCLVGRAVYTAVTTTLFRSLRSIYVLCAGGA